MSEHTPRPWVDFTPVRRMAGYRAARGWAPGLDAICSPLGHLVCVEWLASLGPPGVRSTDPAPWAWHADQVRRALVEGGL